MFHELEVIGSLGRDPDLTYTPAGTPVCNMNVAANRIYKDAKGQQVKETIWFRVSVFGKTAENCAQYLQKGRLVRVAGTLRPDPQTGGPRLYDRKDGTKGASFEVIASTVKFLPSGNGNGGNAKNPQPREEDFEDVPGSGAPAADGWGDDDEQIPL